MQKLGFLLLYVVSALSLIVLFSCNKANKSDDILRQMEESLTNSSKMINYSTELILKELENKTTEPETIDRAKIWYSKAEQVSKLSNGVDKFIDTLKMKLKKEDFPVNLVYNKLIYYKRDILNIDSSILLEFQDSFNFLNSFPEKMTSPVLTTLQNSIKIVENKMIDFCNHKIGSLDGISMFSSYSVIVGQNSTYLKPGDMLEITAGVGYYSRAAMAAVTIQGKKINIGEEGYAYFEMKTPTQPGIYKIPVKVAFINPETGVNELKVFNVEYTVAKLCEQ